MFAQRKIFLVFFSTETGPDCSGMCPLFIGANSLTIGFGGWGEVVLYEYGKINTYFRGGAQFTEWATVGLEEYRLPKAEGFIFAHSYFPFLSLEVLLGAGAELSSYFSTTR